MGYTIHNHVSSKNVPDWGNTHRFIAIHYLGCVGENYDLAPDGTGAHYTIFYDGSIHQRCSHDAVPWAVGTGGYYKQKHPQANNYNTISIELCVKKTNNKGANNLAEDTDWYFTTETQNAAVWLVQKLMDDLSIPIENVLRHYDIVNKWCPAPYCLNNRYKTSWTWDEFKSKLKSTVKEYPNPQSTDANVDKVWMGWTKRETGSAGLRCIHGDAGKAYGLQFDYRFGLVPFMQFCVDYNSERYKGFSYYIQLGAGNAELIYNAGLGKLWQEYYDKYTEEFCELQYVKAYQSYYEEAKRYMKNLYGIDMDKRRPAVKGTLFSMAFRSGALSAAYKFEGCSDSTSDLAMINTAYATYGNEDAKRWTKAGQWGDAIAALESGDCMDIHKKVESATAAKPAEAEKPKDGNRSVKVSIPDLNIRTGAGVGYPATGFTTGIGTFTVTEIKKGAINSSGTPGSWGKLLSGAGWICLSVEGVKLM